MRSAQRFRAGPQDRRELFARAGADPLAGPIQVTFDAAHRHHEAVGDLPVGQSRDDEFGDLPLPAGQRLAGRVPQRGGAQPAALLCDLLRDGRGIRAAFALPARAERDGGLGGGIGGSGPIADGAVARSGREQAVAVAGGQRLEDDEPRFLPRESAAAQPVLWRARRATCRPTAPRPAGTPVRASADRARRRRGPRRGLRQPLQSARPRRPAPIR